MGSITVLPAAGLEATMFWPDRCSRRALDIIAEHARAKLRGAATQPNDIVTAPPEPPAPAEPTVRVERAEPSNATAAETTVDDTVQVPDRPLNQKLRRSQSKKWRWLLLLLVLLRVREADI